MIICPNCLNKEWLGALFCSECGTQLLHGEGDPTTALPQQGEAHLETEPLQSPPRPVASRNHTIAQDATLALNIISHDEMIPIGERNEVTLGRIGKGQPIIPDIDLSPFKAYESGVSRMHASIQIAKNLTTVTDLGSANGTRINGRKINAHTPHPIKNGDVLTLGKCKIQILYT